MPVEINEIVITATIAEAGSADSATSPVNHNNFSKEEMIKACVEEVLRVLKEKEER